MHSVLSSTHTSQLSTARWSSINTIEHCQHLSKVQKLRNELKKALTEKNAVKRLMQLRRAGSDPETVKQLACEFHSLVRAHSRLSKTVKGLERKESQKQQRKECRKDLYKFAKKILNDESYTSTEPAFTAAEAEAYFSQVYSTSLVTFTRPPWMPEPPSPSTGLDVSAFTGGGNSTGHFQTEHFIMPQSHGPDTIPSPQEMSITNSSPAECFPLMLVSEESPSSMEGWSSPHPREEES